MCARDSINSSLIDRLALTTESFIEKAREIHGSRYDYDSVEYLGSKQKVKIRCRKHSFFNQRPNDHLTGSGCQKCKMSKGELLLGKYLRKWNIPYESEFKIAACKNINPLPFDFAIFSLEKKLIGLVEYHGLQHKVPIDFFGGEKSFVRRKIHNKIKEDYCETHNIPLHIVWTDDVDKLKKLERFIETLQT